MVLTYYKEGNVFVVEIDGEVYAIGEDLKLAIQNALNRLISNDQATLQSTVPTVLDKGTKMHDTVSVGNR